MVIAYSRLARIHAACCATCIPSNIRTSNPASMRLDLLLHQFTLWTKTNSDFGQQRYTIPSIIEQTTLSSLSLATTSLLFLPSETNKNEDASLLLHSCPSSSLNTSCGWPRCVRYLPSRLRFCGHGMLRSSWLHLGSNPWGFCSCVDSLVQQCLWYLLRWLCSSSAPSDSMKEQIASYGMGIEGHIRKVCLGWTRNESHGCG